MANAAGILYNRDIFEEYGWTIPETLDEFYALCEEIQSAGIQPLYFGFKDTWTCLAPWNAICVDLAPSDICSQVNAGNATFSEAYRSVAEVTKSLLQYAQRWYLCAGRKGIYGNGVDAGRNGIAEAAV